MRNLDLFGSTVLLRFKGQEAYTTNIGSLMTIGIIALVSTRLIFIISDVVQRNSPQVIYSETTNDNPEQFAITNSTFPFAFSLQFGDQQINMIDETVYTISAIQQTKKMIYNNTTNQYDTIWNNTEYKLQPCTPQNFGNSDNYNYFMKINYQSMYCFPPDAVLYIEGDFYSDTFSQIQLTVQKCKGPKCKDENTINQLLENTSFSIDFADVTVNPKNKNSPFVSYARNLYWITNAGLPKEVTMYLRNNQVISDFGWILENLVQVKKPLYSYTDLTTFPPSFSDFFFTAVIRFEKQKEGVYNRNYKNFNSIISEIGGFTQSLLAIGILICGRISKLQLNQEIINQAFNYEDISEESEEQQNQNLSNTKNDNIQNKNNQCQSPLKNSTYQEETNAKIQILSSPVQQLSISRSGFFSDTPQIVPNLKVQEMCTNKIGQQDKSQINSFFMQSNQQLNESRQPRSIQNYIDLKQSQTKQQSVHDSTLNNTQNQIIQMLQKDLKRKQKNERMKVFESVEEDKEIGKLKRKIFKREKEIEEVKFNELMQEESKSMKLSTCEYFKSLLWPFGKLRQKQRVINYSIDKLQQNLDIFYIIKKLIEVEKLKRLLLDTDQLRLFDYLPKPTISSHIISQGKQINQAQTNKKNEIDLLYYDTRTELEKMRDAFKSFNTIKQKQNPNKIDEKLLTMIDRNLVKLFTTDQQQQQQLQNQQQTQAALEKELKRESPTSQEMRIPHQQQSIINTNSEQLPMKSQTKRDSGEVTIVIENFQQEIQGSSSSRSSKAFNIGEKQGEMILSCQFNQQIQNYIKSNNNINNQENEISINSSIAEEEQNKHPFQHSQISNIDVKRFQDRIQENELN